MVSIYNCHNCLLSQSMMITVPALSFIIMSAKQITQGEGEFVMEDGEN